MRRAAYAALAIVSAVACAKKAPPTGEVPVALATGGPVATATVVPSTSRSLPRTTDPAIALGNLDAQIAGREAIAARDPGDVEAGRVVVELLLTRGQYVGQIRDYERADAIAGELAVRNPQSAAAHLALASTLSTFHLFARALDEIDLAQQGSPAAALRARAGVYLAQGRFDEADALGVLREPPPGQPADATELATAAVLAGERAKDADAERLFDRAAASYRDVSPFPVAWVNYQHAWLLERRGQLARAKAFYADALAVLPSFAHACVHLAALVTPETARDLLQPVLATSDDPAVPAAYADALRRLGHADQAATFLRAARTGYDDLVARHPDAFADHAAAFELQPGGDIQRALDLARRNAVDRSTEAAIDLWLTTASAAGNQVDECAAVSQGSSLRYATAPFRATLETMRNDCMERLTGSR